MLAREGFDPPFSQAMPEYASSAPPRYTIHLEILPI